MPSYPIQASQCIPSQGANKALKSFKDTSSCLRLNAILHHQSSNDTNSDTNLGVGGGVAGSGEADASESISADLRPALSDHRLTGGLQQAGVRWHSYSGALPGSLFDDDVKRSSSGFSKASGSRETSREEAVGLLTGTDKPRKYIFILAPDGNCMFYWLWIVCIACLYNLWVIPYRFAFAEITNATMSLWFTLDYIADTVYLLDLLIGFRMAYLDSGILKKDPILSRQHYLNSTCFYLNCLCILPLDLLYLSVGFKSLLRILRFVKIFKLIDFSDMAQRRSVHPNIIRAIGWIIISVTILHWNACFYNYITKTFGSQHSPSESSSFEDYLHSFYESLLCLTLRKELQPNNMSQVQRYYALLIFEGLIGITLITILIANVNMLISNANVNENDFRRQLAEVRMYLVKRKAPETLKRRVVCWFDYLWRQSHIPDEQRVLKHLPDRLKAEVAIHVHLDTLKRVDMFQDTEEGFLLDLVLRLRPALFSPGDFICRKGEIGKEMFLVSQGKLNVLAADEKTILATLGPGSYFGEISILNMGNVGNRRTASVRSIGFSDLFCLSKEDLWDVLNDYPSAKQKLEKVAFDRLSVCRSPDQSSENFGEMNCMEIQSHPRRSASSVSSVSRRSPFLLPLPLHLSQQPLPPPSRLELKRRRSALSANSSFPCTGHSGGDRHTSLDRSCSIKAPPLLHRQFSLQCNYGETLETFGQGPRKAITTAVIRPQNLIEEAPFQMSLDPVSNTIPQIRFERAATPLGGMRSENDSKQVPVEFSIPEEDQNEENQNQVLLQLPEVNNHLYISSQSTSHSGSGYGSCVASPYLQSSIPMNMFLDLQQRVSTLESENRILSLCLRQAMGQTDLPERPPL